MEQAIAYSDQRYRMLAFLAGFGAVGALGCESIMQEEKTLSELVGDETAGETISASNSRPEIDLNEEPIETITEE